ncbi:DUF1987 domain-containing protein [Rariglobus hedericola]|uniref:DUF1987 domain-containing protein n=1 Tax=Rariglobus hedericola TaxID=2597822 RepID=A0A556QJC3_9BACT|nr:DUF1987 domain-containing protein [Rariglobus hedericola]TSJ76736.1 DUF1987 domain-containing protein [Rariglobus hedericola]
MTALDLPPTDTTPHVRYDAASSTLRIEGESYPENVSDFYAPLFSWLREFLADKPAFKVVLAFSYLNTSSTKALLDLLLQLDDYHRSGGQIEVEWHYRPALEVMQEAGEEFGEDLSLPYRLVAI